MIAKHDSALVVAVVPELAAVAHHNFVPDVSEDAVVPLFCSDLHCCRSRDAKRSEQRVRAPSFLKKVLLLCENIATMIKQKGCCSTPGSLVARPQLRRGKAFWRFAPWLEYLSL